jgi:chromosome segregation ATPase
MDRIDRLQAALEELTARVEKLTHRLELNEARVTQIMDTMNRLPNIVSSHEERLEDLEGR